MTLVKENLIQSLYGQVALSKQQSKALLEPLLELFLLPAEIIMPCHVLYAKAQLSNQRD